MDDKLKSCIESFPESFLSTANFVATYGNKSVKDVNIFTEMMAQILTIEHRALIEEAALEMAQNENNLADFERVYRSEIEKPDDFNPTTTEQYEIFRARVESILSTERNEIKNTSINAEDSDCIMESTESHIDPLTKLHIFNPVVNKLCGHYYEKYTIMEAIDVNPNMRCPVMACPNKIPVREEHLAEDAKLKHKMSTLACRQDDDVE